jgi:hypothetical protein
MQMDLFLRAHGLVLELARLLLLVRQHVAFLAAGLLFPAANAWGGNGTNSGGGGAGSGSGVGCGASGSARTFYFSNALFVDLCAKLINPRGVGAASGGGHKSKKSPQVADAAAEGPSVEEIVDALSGVSGAWGGAGGLAGAAPAHMLLGSVVWRDYAHLLLASFVAVHRSRAACLTLRAVFCPGCAVCAVCLSIELLACYALR